MTPTTLIWVVATACGLLAMGFAAGVILERQCWLVRAATRDNPDAAAHHCDGRFYMVLEEDYFLQEYMRRSVADPEGQPQQPAPFPSRYTGLPLFLTDLCPDEQEGE